ncbi:Small-conductance mechanosensitive channel [Planctomycetes bacterium Pla163]|uniref:Small-conductance mechanosensitive channel n=1 Tax=Rohdeia mirabilis TaxID=2528008 RepID=A0A518CVA2_9BACT|nr:Small-conductance mechanosensitive channel [Planctomycetes bacterium Pla163]
MRDTTTCTRFGGRGALVVATFLLVSIACGAAWVGSAGAAQESGLGEEVHKDGGTVDESESVRAASPIDPQDGAVGDAAEVQAEAEADRAASEAETTEIRSEEAKLGARAAAILAAVDDFDALHVTVEAGIVVLSGTAPSSDVVDQARATLEQLDGVLMVIDDVAIERALSVRLGDSWRSVVVQLREVVVALPLYLAALAIVVLFWLLARVLRDVDLLYRPASSRALLQLLLRQTVYFVVVVLGVVAALRFVDAGGVIGTILGAAGVLGIALGFAFRNIVENYLAGVLLAVRQPFRARDVVDIDGQVGTILRMTASETTLMDVEGNHVRLPNAMIFNGKVLNFTRNPLRRFTVSVGVGTTVDLEQAQRVGIETLLGMKGVIDDPDPSAIVATLGDSSVQLEFYGWVDQQASSYSKVASEANRLVKEAFDAAGIEMPPPEYALRLRSALPVESSVDSSDSGATPASVTPARSPVAPKVGPAPRGDSIDVSPESDIDGQVAKELAESTEKDLLE